jgi:hypothetical protein
VRIMVDADLAERSGAATPERALALTAHSF